MNDAIAGRKFIKNHDKDEKWHSLACLLIEMLLKEKNLRPAYYKEAIHGKYPAGDIYKLARMNNVVIRVIEAANGTLDGEIISLWQKITADEKARCERSSELIRTITRSLDEDSIRYAIIKTLDSYPDFGNDVDMFIERPFSEMKRWVIKKHGGCVRHRKITEVMCGKMSVDIPGHPLLELHCERMGQVGEEPALAQSIIKRRSIFDAGTFKAYTPSPEERIIVITIHRLYRHLSFKISDIINAASIVKSADFDWDYLLSLADECGVTEGVKYLLGVLENTHISYAAGKFLPERPASLAKSNAELSFRHFFLRIPLFRVPPGLYAAEAASFLKRGKFGSLARLSMVPLLSCVAYITIKLFKDDWVW